jgi:dienelactone hydrolase
VRRLRWLLLVPALVAFAAFAKEKDPAAAEAKLKPDAAKLVAEYASWCSSHGAKKEGVASLDEATALDPQTPKLAETKTALDALTDDAPDAAAVAAQRKASGPKIAAAYDHLAAIDHEAKDAGRFEEYLFRALAWETTPGRLAKIRKSIDDAAGGNHPDEAGRLLVRLKRADADGVAAGRYEKLETDFATKDVLLLGSDTHALVGYVSLPKDWTKTKTYQVVVGVEGAGCNFLGYARGLMAQRGARSAIVVAPVTLSNTNELKAETYPCYGKTLLDEWNAKRMQFDGPGVDALLAVVHKRFGGEEKVFVTGFSGGGQYAYFKLLQDPTHVRGAAPCCGNFGGAGAEGAPAAGADGGPPVHLFTGEKDQYREHVNDEPGIEAQTDKAEAALQKLGYTHVERTQVKGAGHDPFPGLVWKFVDQVLGVK